MIVAALLLSIVSLRFGTFRAILSLQTITEWSWWMLSPAAKERQRLLNVRLAMLSRCYDQTNPQFKDYGGRGITVCDRWRRCPRAFIEDVGPRPTGMTIDRVDNDKSYGPDNFRWATRAEQDDRKRYRDDPERVKSARRAANSPTGLRLRAEWAANSKKSEPEKWKARNAVNNALRSGKIERKPCYFCGSDERLQAHHEDYSRPLDVIWLCASCHGKLHAINGDFLRAG